MLHSNNVPSLNFDELLERALQGDKFAYSMLKNRISTNQLSDTEIKNIIAATEIQITKNNSIACYIRASMHTSSKFGPINYPAAIRLYNQAISLNNDDAMNALALIYQFGRGGMTFNISTVIKLFQQSVGLGNTDAMNNLANFYIEHLAYSQLHIEEAIKLYKSAIELGHETAIYDLAIFCFKMDRMTRKEAEMESARLYRLGAEKGFQEAKEKLGRQSTPHGKYHYAMFMGDINTVLQLFRSEDISSEITFDINRSSKNEHLSNLIEKLLKVLEGNSTQTDAIKALSLETEISEILMKSKSPVSLPDFHGCLNPLNKPQHSKPKPIHQKLRIFDGQVNNANNVTLHSLDSAFSNTQKQKKYE